jgi:hypothetical protein
MFSNQHQVQKVGKETEEGTNINSELKMQKNASGYIIH